MVPSVIGEIEDFNWTSKAPLADGSILEQRPSDFLVTTNRTTETERNLGVAI